MKKYFGWMAAVWLAASTAAWADGTVVVAPARISVMQVGMDLAARYGVTLVSYQGEASTANPLLHLWNGTSWEFLSLDEFVSGKFLAAKPTQTLVIGDEKFVPEVFAPMSAWAGKLQKIPALGTADILNTAGQALKFRAADWQWFSARYNMKVEDLNTALRQDSIYKHKVGEPLTLRRRDEAKKTTTGVPPAAIIEPAAQPDAVPAPAAK